MLDFLVYARAVHFAATTLLAESVLLAAAGGICGLLLANELGHLLVALLGTPGNSLFLDLEPDARVFACAAGIAGFTCILFGLIPALRATRIDPMLALRDE